MIGVMLSVGRRSWSYQHALKAELSATVTSQLPSCSSGVHRVLQHELNTACASHNSKLILNDFAVVRHDNLIHIAVILCRCCCKLRYSC
jgi:hypothetical protein